MKPPFGGTLAMALRSPHASEGTASDFPRTHPTPPLTPPPGVVELENRGRPGPGAAADTFRPAPPAADEPLPGRGASEDAGAPRRLHQPVFDPWQHELVFRAVAAAGDHRKCDCNDAEVA